MIRTLHSRHTLALKLPFQSIRNTRACALHRAGLQSPRRTRNKMGVVRPASFSARKEMIEVGGFQCRASKQRWRMLSSAPIPSTSDLEADPCGEGLYVSSLGAHSLPLSSQTKTPLIEKENKIPNFDIETAPVQENEFSSLSMTLTGSGDRSPDIEGVQSSGRRKNDDGYKQSAISAIELGKSCQSSGSSEKTGQDFTKRKKERPVGIQILTGHLKRSIESGDIDRAMDLFGNSVELDYNLNEAIFLCLIDLLLPRYIDLAHSVLQRYVNVAGRLQHVVDVKVYKKMCEAIGYVDATMMTQRKLMSFVHCLSREIRSLDKEAYQHICLPLLILSLVGQKSESLRHLAGPIYNYMEANDFPVDVALYEKILSKSRYTGPDALPEYKLLHSLVIEGYRPDPSVVLNALQNLYPFNNTVATMSMLNSILALHRSSDGSLDALEYGVDMGTLEQIASSGARMAMPDLVLLVWDALDEFGLRPTEAMFECAIQAFVLSSKNDHNAFAVLNEMEQNGFVPSRALIRSVSRSIRASTARVDNAYYILIGKDNGAQITTSSLNCILSACAENALVDRAFATFDDFSAYSVDHDADTFSFLLEALSVDVSRKIPVKMAHSAVIGNCDEPSQSIAQQFEVESQLEAAYAVVGMMEDAGISLAKHTLHEYVRILCYVDDLETAWQLVEDTYERKEHVFTETFAILATHFALNGQFEIARHVAAKTGRDSPVPYLYKRIQQIEKGN